MIKVLKFLLKVEKWVLERMIGSDDEKYEEYCEIVKRNEKTIELLEQKGGRNEL